MNDWDLSVSSRLFAESLHQPQIYHAYWSIRRLGMGIFSSIDGAAFDVASIDDAALDDAKYLKLSIITKVI